MKILEKIKTYLLGIFDYLLICITLVGCLAIAVVYILPVGLYYTLIGDIDSRDKLIDVNLKKVSK